MNEIIDNIQLIGLVAVLIVAPIYLWATKTGRYDKKDDD